MKSKIIFGVISLLLVLPLTGQAFTMDSVMLKYIKTLKERIYTLEVENKELKSNQCLGTVMIPKKMIPKKKVEKKEQPTLATVTVIPKGQDDEGYNLDLKIEGIFDTAFVRVTDQNDYAIATVHLQRSNNIIPFNALTKGTYKYTVEAKKGTEKSILSGEFDIDF